MKYPILLLLLSLFIINCSTSVEQESVNETVKLEVVETIEIPDNSVVKTKLHYDNMTSTWTLDGQLFTGYALTNYPDGTPMQKFGIHEGKQQNEALDWYPDGHLRLSAHYHKGKLHGEKKSWSPDTNHRLVLHYNFYLGKGHGEQKRWYPTGERFQVLQLNLGKEEGIQQAYRKNGALYANYEVKNGRIYGLKKAALCFGLEDEALQLSENAKSN